MWRIAEYRRSSGSCPPIVTDAGMALAGCGCVLHLGMTGNGRMRWQQSRLYVKDLDPNVSHETVRRGSNTFESKAVQDAVSCVLSLNNSPDASFTECRITLSNSNSTTQACSLTDAAVG